MSNYCKECFKKQEEIERLKQENERLKDELDRAESGERDEIYISNQYKKTLESIRDIVAQPLEIAYREPLSNIAYLCKLLNLYTNKLNEILNKALEVIDV